MPKPQSDVFICKLGSEDYWAYPSPFVAHGVGAKIQFRNLTGDEIEIDFGKAPLDKKTLPLKPKGAGLVTVIDPAPADLYEYEALVMVPAAASAVGAGGKPLIAVKVKGGSSPKIIIDT